MKLITKKYQAEDAKFFCDKHTDRECFSELHLTSWYGSIFDLKEVKVHLCDVCVKEIQDLIKKEFKVEPKDIDI